MRTRFCCFGCGGARRSRCWPRCANSAPLLVAPADFWQPAESLDGLRVAIKPPLTPLPLLKRLGQPNFVDEDLQRLLGPVYQAISRVAIPPPLGRKRLMAKSNFR